MSRYYNLGVGMIPHLSAALIPMKQEVGAKREDVSFVAGYFALRRRLYEQEIVEIVKIRSGQRRD